MTKCSCPLRSQEDCKGCTYNENERGKLLFSPEQHVIISLSEYLAMHTYLDEQVEIIRRKQNGEEP